MTYNVFSGTLNPTHFTSLEPSDFDLGIWQAELSSKVRSYTKARNNKEKCYYKVVGATSSEGFF